jgi:hypothetical protein
MLDGADQITKRDEVQACRDYISDMLAELAQMASVQGDRRLALTLQMVALDAARRAPSLPN